MLDPNTGRWLEDDPIGFAAGDGNLARYLRNNPLNATDPTGLAPLPVDDFDKAQKIANQGLPEEDAGAERAGPDVTKWFARDLIIQLKHSINMEKKGMWGISKFKDQAANKMSYKWLDFGAPKSGKGLNTVVLGDVVMRKQELGNISFMIVPRVMGVGGATWVDAAALAKEFEAAAVIDIPRGSVLSWKPENTKSGVEQVARVGYSIEPYYHDVPFAPESKTSFVYRGDNLAAFGVGDQIALSFLEAIAPAEDGKHDKAREILKEKLLETDENKVNKNIQELSEIMEKVIRDLLKKDGDTLAKVVENYGKLQPLKDRPKITPGALSFTPDYGGFNFNSLKTNSGEFKSKDNTIAAETRMYRYFQRSRLPGDPNDDAAYQHWRQVNHEKWTEPGGFKFDDIPPSK